MYEPLAELLRPYERAAVGAEMDDSDPIYALLKPTRSPVQATGLPTVNAAPGSLEALVMQMAARRHGWSGPRQQEALYELIDRESGWDPYAENPTSTAADLFQFLDSTRANYGLPLHAAPRRQARAGLDYIDDRYDSPLQALRFHDREGYY